MRATTILLACLLQALGAAAAHGQGRDTAGPVALGPSLGLHGLGLAFEVSLVARATLALQLEGLNFGGKAVAGIGGRFDLHREETGRVYARVLYGKMRCGNSFGGSGGCPFGNAARSAMSPGGGVELRLSERGTVWAGIEAGYWKATNRDPLGRDLEHWSFAAIVRFRPRGVDR